MKSRLKQLARIAIRQGITGPLASIFTGGVPITPRAMGGPVSADAPYMVGERGPEMFVPKSPGMIIPKNLVSRGGAGGVVVNFAPSYNVQGSGPEIQKLRMQSSHRLRRH